jgi:hypothetical protein
VCEGLALGLEHGVDVVHPAHALLVVLGLDLEAGGVEVGLFDLYRVPDLGDDVHGGLVVAPDGELEDVAVVELGPRADLEPA